jgi:hypothetical protein
MPLQHRSDHTRPAPRLTRLLVCAAALLALPALAQEKLDSFSTRLPITSEAAMPYYRLSVPLQAYLASAHGDLRDLRVFNAGGQPVPYALLAASGSTEESVQRHELRWFPLRASVAGQHDKPDGDSTLNVVVKQAGDGTLVEINSKRGASGPAPKQDAAPLRGYVLDASRITDRQAVRALDIDWEKTGGDFQLLDVESSDDLQHWNSVATGVQLARLDYNGARIETRRIDLHGFRDRYLRLIWREPAAAPTLTRVELQQSSSSYQSAPLAWSAPMAASASDADLKPGEYRFHLAQPLPVARLRIELPPGNQLLPLEVLSPGRERRHWRSLASTVAYRIKSKGREWTNTDIPLSGYPIQDFVLRVDPRLNPLTQGPQLAFALQPAQIVFLASGEAPYTLAIGNKEAKDATLSPTTLVPGFGSPNSPDIANASIAETRTASSSTASTAVAAPTPAPERDWKKIALWSVLVLGVLGMGAMAWQLLRQMNKPAE